MGPSGSGKTILLNMLGGVDRPTSGDIIFNGKAIQHYSEGELAKWRAQHVGFIFQFYNLMPMLSAEKNVELPLLLKKLSRDQRRKSITAALKLVGLSDRARHLPKELSGGQQQRVAIARAIVSDPDLLLCDEPTGDLDRTTATEILETLQLLNKEFGKTIVMVTHDLDSLYAICDRVSVLVDKRVKVGTIAELMREPDPWIQDYFGGPRGRAAAGSAARAEAGQAGGEQEAAAGPQQGA